MEAPSEFDQVMSEGGAGAPAPPSTSPFAIPTTPEPAGSADANAAEDGSEFDSTIQNSTENSNPNGEPTQPVSDSPSMADYAADAAKGVVRGVRGAAHSLGDLILPDSMKDDAYNAGLPDEATPQTGIGHVVASITQAALAYGMGGAILKGAGVAVQGVKAAVAQSAIGTPLVGDVTQERISNQLANYPWLEPAANLLAQNPNDPVLIAKAKATLEDVLTTATAAKVFNGLHLLVLKASGKGTAEGIAAAEQAVVHEAPIGQVAAAVKPPVTISNAAGDNLVTLGAKEQATYEAAMSKLVGHDAVGGITHELEAGAVPGSMNAKYLDAPAMTLRALKELGDVTVSQLEKSGPGYRSIEDTHRLASLLGEDPSNLRANLQVLLGGTKDADVTITGARQFIVGQSKAMLPTAQKAFVGEDPAALDAFRKQYMDLAQVQAQLKQASTSIARGLRSMGSKVGPIEAKASKEADAAELVKQKDALAKVLSDPEEAKKMARMVIAADGDADKIAAIQRLQAMSFGEKALGAHNEYWTGLGLLSRGTTQVANIIGNLSKAVLEPAALTTGGTLRGLTGNGWAEAREGLALYNGMRTNFFDSARIAYGVLKSGKSVLSQAGTMEQPTEYISALSFNMNPDTFMAGFVDGMGKIVRASFRGLTAGDEFFKQLSYRGKISATATRQAMDLVRSGKLTRDGVDGFVQKALQDSIDAGGAAKSADALAYAEKASLVNDLKVKTWFNAPSTGESMAMLASNPVLRGTLLPFVKTPTNVMRTTFEYTPVIGQLRRQFYDDMAKGGEAQALAMGRLTLGAGMYTGSMMLALEGRITGGQPAPGILMPTGWKPYSFVVHLDSGDRYISYQRLQPFGDILGLTADFAKMTGALDVNTRDGLAHSMSLALGQILQPDHISVGGVAKGGYTLIKSVMSKTYLRSLTELLSAFDGSQGEVKLERWIDDKIGSYVPGVLAQFNNDPAQREVRGLVDSLKAKIPSMSATLPAARDYFGQLKDTKVGLPYSLISPMAVSDAKHDPVMNELSRLSQSSAGTKFNPMEHNEWVNGKQIDLRNVKNAQGKTAFDRMNELMASVKPAGRSQSFHDALGAEMQSPRYNLAKGTDLALDGTPHDPGPRTTMVKALEAQYRSAARDQMLQEFSKELGIKSPLDNKINENVTRKKARVGIVEQLTNLNNK